MSYYYEDPEYTDYSNHGDEYNEYELYSDYTKPDHYEYEDSDTQYHNNTDHEDAPEEFEHGHKESKYEGDEVNERGELIHDDDRTGGGQGIEDGSEAEVYEHGEAKNEGHKLWEPKYKEHELRELAHYKDRAHEAQEIEPVLDEWGHRHQGPEYHSDDMPGTTRGEYKHGDSDDDTYTPTSTYVHLPPSLLPSTYRDYTPLYVPPIPFSFTPTPAPLVGNPSNTNQ